MYFLYLGNQRHQRPRDAEGVRPQTRQFLKDLYDSPAFVLGRYLGILAWNRLATAVLKDVATVRRQERNFLRVLFLDAEFRGRYVD